VIASDGINKLVEIEFAIPIDVHRIDQLFCFLRRDLLSEQIQQLDDLVRVELKLVAGK
jgi:hypothetical protein